MSDDTNVPPAAGGEIELFVNDEFEIHVNLHDLDGLRVQAPGLARALGYHSAKDLLRSIPDDEKGVAPVPTPGGDQRVGYLTETGLNRALGQRQASRITDASVRERVMRFQKWVFGEVLPALRRGELVPAPAATTPAIPDMSTAEGQLAVLDMWRGQVEARMVSDRRALEAEQRNAELEPKAAAADALMDSEGTVSMGAVANAFKVGRQELFDMLRAERILQKDRRPYQEYTDWFRVAIKHYDDANGIRRPYVNTRMYTAGAVRLHVLLTRRGRELRKPVFDAQLSLLSGGAV